MLFCVKPFSYNRWSKDFLKYSRVKAADFDEQIRSVHPVLFESYYLGQCSWTNGYILGYTKCVLVDELLYFNKWLYCLFWKTLVMDAFFRIFFNCSHKVAFPNLINVFSVFYRLQNETDPFVSHKWVNSNCSVLCLCCKISFCHIDQFNNFFDCTLVTQ